MGSSGVLLQLTGVLNMKEHGPGAPSPVPAEAEGAVPLLSSPSALEGMGTEDGAASPRTPGRAQQAPLRASQHHVPCGNACQSNQSPEVQGDGDLKENKTASPCSMPRGDGWTASTPCAGAEGNPGLPELTGRRASWRRWLGAETGQEAGPGAMSAPHRGMAQGSAGGFWGQASWAEP